MAEEASISHEELAAKKVTTPSSPLFIEDVNLEDEWSMWFESKDKEKSGMSETDYLNNLVDVGTFNTLKGFMAKWESLDLTPAGAPAGNVHIFKKGVRPIWEDEYNINGGKWAATVLKDQEEYARIVKMWLTLAVAVLTGQLGHNDDICGIVFADKQWGHSLHVWNRNADDQDQQESVKQTLCKLLKVKKIKYVRHKTSLQKNTGDKKEHHKFIPGRHVSPDIRGMGHMHDKHREWHGQNKHHGGKGHSEYKEYPPKNPLHIPPFKRQDDEHTTPVVTDAKPPLKNPWNIPKQTTTENTANKVASPPLVARQVKGWDIPPKDLDPTPPSIVVQEAANEAPAKPAANAWNLPTHKRVDHAPPTPTVNEAPATESEPAVPNNFRRKNSLHERPLPAAMNYSPPTRNRSVSGAAPTRVWDGKRMIDHLAATPVPPEKITTRRASFEHTSNVPPASKFSNFRKSHSRAKSQSSTPHQKRTTPFTTITDVSSLDDDWRTRGDDKAMAVRGRSATVGGEVLLPVIDELPGLSQQFKDDYAKSLRDKNQHQPQPQQQQQQHPKPPLQSAKPKAVAETKKQVHTPAESVKGENAMKKSAEIANPTSVPVVATKSAESAPELAQPSPPLVAEEATRAPAEIESATTHIISAGNEPREVPVEPKETDELVAEKAAAAAPAAAASVDNENKGQANDQLQQPEAAELKQRKTQQPPPQQQKKKEKEASNKPAKQKSTQQQHLQQQQQQQQQELQPFPFQQAVIVGGVALVSIVSYYLFM